MGILFVLLAGCDAGAGSESGNAATVPGAAVTWHQEEFACADDEPFYVDVGTPYVWQVLNCQADGRCSDYDTYGDLTEDGLRVECVADTTRRVSWAE